jgi:hypothetical protein
MRAPGMSVSLRTLLWALETRSWRDYSTPCHIPIISPFIRWDEKAALHGMRYAPNDRRAQVAMERKPAHEKAQPCEGVRTVA